MKESQAYYTLGDWGISQSGEIPASLVKALNHAGGFEDYGHQGADPNGWEADAAASPRGPAEVRRERRVNSTTQDKNTASRKKPAAVLCRSDFNGELADRKWHSLFGLRYETTDVRSKSDVLVPTAIRWTDNNDYFIDRATHRPRQ